MDRHCWSNRSEEHGHARFPRRWLKRVGEGLLAPAALHGEQRLGHCLVELHRPLTRIESVGSIGISMSGGGLLNVGNVQVHRSDPRRKQCQVAPTESLSPLLPFPQFNPQWPCLVGRHVWRRWAIGFTLRVIWNVAGYASLLAEAATIGCHVR